LIKASWAVILAYEANRKVDKASYTLTIFIILYFPPNEWSIGGGDRGTYTYGINVEFIITFFLENPK
jgi:hypothetical protein